MRRPQAPRDRPRPAGRAGPAAGACPPRRSSPTPSASSPRCCRPTAPPRWRSVCGSTLSLMDAGVPIKAPVAGIAMGLVYAEGKLHHPHRHPRRRGRVRRHGLQGGRHGRVRDRPAARHQDRRPPGRRAGPGARPGQGGPAQDPRRSWHDGHRRAPRRGRRAPPRRSSASRSRSTRSARSSGPRARSSTPSSRRPAPTSPSTTTAWSGTVTIGAKDGGAVAGGRAPDRAHPRPADRRGGRDLQGQGRQHHQVRGLRQHPPRPRRPLHISKLGGGKRIERVEDVVDLGDEIEVVVDDIDPQGKVSLSLVGAAPTRRPRARPTGRARRRRRMRPTTRRRRRRSPRASRSRTPSTPRLRGEFGDLGPAAPAGTDAPWCRSAAPRRRGGDRRRRVTRPPGPDRLTPPLIGTVGRVSTRASDLLVTERMADVRSVGHRLLGRHRVA